MLTGIFIFKGIFRSKTKDLPTEYRASAQGIFNTMEDMIGYNTFATQLGADNLVRYDELYRELWTTIIRVSCLVYLNNLMILNGIIDRELQSLEYSL